MRRWWPLLAALIAGLALRLAVWQWHAQYPLSGDEQEYFAQALQLLQGRGYRELPLMRPPLYTVFLAVVFQLFDSQVQRVRLVQALVSAAGVAATWWLAHEAAAEQPAARRDRVANVAAWLAALSWTLAVSATELLTETLFIAGLTVAFALLLGAARRMSWRWAVAAGAIIGALTLLRSVGLPLIGLGALWLVIAGRDWRGWRWRLGASFALAAALVILPWTARNAVVYRALIVVDTTGAENLWLDNDPTGREAVKRQLYALGDDRAARQRLASARGLAVIVDQPGRFFAKVGREATALVALEFFDDLRDRPGIWVRPAEVWLRLVLGDGGWLLLLLIGGAGLWRLPRRLGWLWLPWAAYVALTSLIFHVELRYRLPLYPVLLISAAEVLTVRSARAPRWRWLGAGATVAALLGTPAPAPPVSARGAAGGPQALGALAWRRRGGAATRPWLTLARVTLARQALARYDGAAALSLADAAIAARPAQPYAHLLRGDLLRQRGDLAAAGAEFAWETRSLEDLQRWSWNVLGSSPPAALRLGQADLGWLAGFHAAEKGGVFRWTTARARLKVPAGARGATLRIASGREAITVTFALLDAAGTVQQRLTAPVGHDWQAIELPPEFAAGGPGYVLEMGAPTFRPRNRDRASPDNRALGMQLESITWTVP